MITSTQNQRIKHLLLLQQKSAQRRADGLFVVEGRREVEHCIEAGYTLRTVFVCEEISPHPTPPGGSDWMPSSGEAGWGPDVEVVPVSRNVYERIAYRGGTEGIVAVVEAHTTSLGDLRLSDSPLIVVLESVEKPGNLGAVLRSADAAGADAVVVCDPLTDLYNPNLIRSAVGALFTVPCVACSTEECIAFFKEKGIRILTAQLQDSSLYYNTHGYRDGDRSNGADRPVASGSRCSHPHPHAGPFGLAQCFGQRSHPAFRGCPSAADK